jgi:hypothetical protein
MFLLFIRRQRPGLCLSTLGLVRNNYYLLTIKQPTIMDFVIQRATANDAAALADIFMKILCRLLLQSAFSKNRRRTAMVDSQFPSDYSGKCQTGRSPSESRRSIRNR